MKRLSLACITLALIAGCSDNASNSKHPTTASRVVVAGHGEPLALGEMTIGEYTMTVTRFGDMTPGKESAIEVKGKNFGLYDMENSHFYIWIEEKSGQHVSNKIQGTIEAEAMHFHVTPWAGSQPFRVAVQIRRDDFDASATLPLDGHGHEHADNEGPHHGLIAAFTSGSISGFVELKLHDDKGDLELWLASDHDISKPYDLPIAATPVVEFVDVAHRKVTLRVRNTDKNEDEDGTPNLRDGKTNYFIYPSKAGEDASWLMGKEFNSIVIVTFTGPSGPAKSEEFVLTPHHH